MANKEGETACVTGKNSLDSSFSHIDMTRTTSQMGKKSDIVKLKSQDGIQRSAWLNLIEDGGTVSSALTVHNPEDLWAC